MPFERSSGFVTYGVVYDVRSAHEYRIDDDSAVRLTHHFRPPFALNQSICSAIRKIVASAGVLYVWSRREFSIAVMRSYEAGIQRPEALISSARAIAAGDIRANQMPPSDAKHFCGAK